MFAADALNADGDNAIVDAFRRSRDEDYAAFKHEAAQLLAAVRKRQGVAASGRELLSRRVSTLRERFVDIERIDFGNTPGRHAAAQILAALERRLAEYTHSPSRVAPLQSTTDLHNRRWVTRPRPGVDRMASAWLIRRSIDPTATFAFVDQPTDSDVPFDMYTGEFSHQGPLCTFETLAERFGLRDATVARIGQIVHDRHESNAVRGARGPAVGRMVDGLRHRQADDHVLLEQGIAMFEALARSFDSSVGALGLPRRARRQKSPKPRRARR